jgi:hypothetical protein
MNDLERAQRRVTRNLWIVLALLVVGVLAFAVWIMWGR